MGRMVSVILQEDVPNLGQVGEIVSVRPGFACNFLLPQHKALVASKRSVSELAHQKRLTEHRKQQLKSESQSRAEVLNKVQVSIPAKAGENEKLFGSVGTRDIARALEMVGHHVSHRSIKLEEPIKQLGSVQVPIRLQADVMATIKVLIVPESADEVTEEDEDVEEAVVGTAPEFRSLDYF